MKRKHIPSRLDHWVRVRARNVCEYCLLPQEFQEATFHVDHILPQARSGATVAGNLALACVSCSLRKGARALPFHPRRDKWTKHFAWSTEWRMRGKTAVGNAMILALQLNRPAMVEIRKLLAEIGRFPPKLYIEVR